MAKRRGWADRPHADWYLVDGSAVLDPLNEAAVSSTRRGSHDVLAHAMRAGAGSLLQLCDAAADVAGARWATWLSTPTGMPYAPFYLGLAPVRGRDGVSLWRRQMVLGPTPEFCLLSPDSLELLPGFVALALRLDPLA